MPWLAVILLGLLSGLTTLIGVGLALWLGNSARAIATGMGFSAGIMIVISACELIPESVSEVGLLPSLLTAAFGAALLASLNRVIPHTHLLEGSSGLERQLLRSAYLVALGLILHDFPEGFAMANAFIASPSLGILVALAIALHNIPEEFALAAPVIALRRRRFLFGAATVSALAEPAGAVVGLVATRIEPSLNASFMAFAAGAMVFVSLHELYPMARRHGHPLFFGLGAAASLGVYALLSVAIPHYVAR